MKPFLAFFAMTILVLFLLAVRQDLNRAFEAKAALQDLAAECAVAAEIAWPLSVAGPQATEHLRRQATSQVRENLQSMAALKGLRDCQVGLTIDGGGRARVSLEITTEDLIRLPMISITRLCVTAGDQG